MAITLRPASLDDAPLLAAFGRMTFCAAFGHLYRKEDLNTFLNEVFSDGVVAGEIEGSETIHQLAWDADKLVSYCKLHAPSWYADHSDAANPIALGQLYTDPARTSEGIGAKLMEWTLIMARDDDHDAIQLTVWSENHGAQRFYQRYGFEHVADIDFYVGNHRDDEFLYELRL